MKKALGAVLLVVAFTAPALAGQYWVVLDSNTGRCSVVTVRPNDPACWSAAVRYFVGRTKCNENSQCMRC